MKLLSKTSFSLFFLFTSAVAFAQGFSGYEQRPIPNVSVVISQPGAADSGAALERRFCCNNENNRACYVFGNASCTNCTSFCEGSMFVDPLDKFGY